jgi:hypothetical protein
MGGGGAPPIQAVSGGLGRALALRRGMHPAPPSRPTSPPGARPAPHLPWERPARTSMFPNSSELSAA